VSADVGPRGAVRDPSRRSQSLVSVSLVTQRLVGSAELWHVSRRRTSLGVGMNAAFEVHVDRDCVVWLSGELDMATAAEFAMTAMGALDGQRELVVDLSALRFLDSTGIQAIIETARRTDRGVVLRRPRPNVQRVIDLTGVTAQHGIRIEV
jgi:stage II sporulation protein AA (anti-sigma F factor antagonist)